MTPLLSILFLTFFSPGLPVPIAQSLGCTPPLSALSPEKRAFCCERFNFDCTVIPVVKVAVTPPPQPPHHIPSPVRLLGELCPTNTKCGEGLYCRDGRCVRRRTLTHLKSLLRRGELVEEAEKEDATVLEADKEEDVVVEGQSVKTNDTDEDEDVVEVEGLRKEEDEVAGNVADLLAQRMGVDLDRKEIEEVRRIIAGTLDERAQREDQAAEGESLKDIKMPNEEKVLRVENDGGKGVPQAKSGGDRYYSRYEPLVQCSSERGGKLAREVAEVMRLISRKRASRTIGI